MSELEIITNSAAQTQALGRLIGAACQGGEVVLLRGDLGAGKTTLTQGIAAGLGVMAPVISPTFIVLREYEGRLPLYHFDFYRLEGTGRAVDLEFDDYVGGAGVCVVEWPAHAPELVPAEYLQITLEPRGEESRALRCEAVGARYVALCERVRAEAAAGREGVSP